jgi:hypothetical protein
MPSTSKKQSGFMKAVANNPAFAKKVGVPTSVGKDFSAADKGRKFKEGGAMKDIKQDKAMAKKAVGMHESQLHGGKKSDMSKLKKGGMPKMAMGGMPAATTQGTPRPRGGFSQPGVAQRPTTPTVGMPRPRQPGVTPKPFMPQPGVAPKPSAPTGNAPRMAKGGGIEAKGKTKGKMVKMKSGGRYC